MVTQFFAKNLDYTPLLALQLELLVYTAKSQYWLLPVQANDSIVFSRLLDWVCLLCNMIAKLGSFPSSKNELMDMLKQVETCHHQTFSKHP